MGSKKVNTIGIDSNIFIYYFQAHPQFGPSVKAWFEDIINGKIKATASIIAKTELLSYKKPPRVIKDLKDKFESIPNLVVYDVDNDVALKAAGLRRKYGFRTPDAIALATAIVTHAEAFLTSDGELKKCKEIKVIVINTTRKSI